MNYIVKVEEGKPVIYGMAGKDGNDAPVYVFEEEEAYDAALAAGMIPVGAVVIKTYDGTEMAGGPFDDALSEESDNAVQNKTLTPIINGIKESRATNDTFGLSKICPVTTTDVTESNGIVLGGFEKNAALAGTLANRIETVYNTIATRKLLYQKTANLVEGDSLVLSSSDYDVLEVFYYFDSVGYVKHFPKGYTFVITHINASYDSTFNSFVSSRTFSYVNETKYNVSKPTLYRFNGTFEKTESWLQISKIYGIKYSQNVVQ